MKKLSPNARLCPLCARPSKKKGFTRAGSQRWYCSTCHYNFTIKRADHKRKKQFT
ncbi:IS1/IS1595 family N-terminal zinc-binding domain-containing protein [Trueperella pyogenes]|uniref:IS1/IS1595 family N-terminal zinc-binding domain-containing protein n=1 Tax=Trueperella pyogenes TaxID=1661 RepID=UPI003BF4C84D